MKVYILSAGYQYEGLKIIEVFDSEEKAKNFCNTKFGTKPEEWTYDEESDYYFYDPIEGGFNGVLEYGFNRLLEYDDFKITIKIVL